MMKRRAQSWKHFSSEKQKSCEIVLNLEAITFSNLYKCKIMRKIMGKYCNLVYVCLYKIQ